MLSKSPVFMSRRSSSSAGRSSIALGANGATTTYPFKIYNVNGSTIYKHIFANGEPVADVKGSTTTAAVYYIHDDHLGGSSVISDANANVAQVLEITRSAANTRIDFARIVVFRRANDPIRWPRRQPKADACG